MTPSEREAFDALVKYAEMEEDLIDMTWNDWDSKYDSATSEISSRIDEQRRLAICLAQQATSKEGGL